MDTDKRNGTRHRCSGLSSYRKLIKLTAVAATLVGLTLITVSPTLALSPSVTDLLGSAKPVAPVNPVTDLTSKASLPLADNSPALKAVATGHPTPEISAEVTAAEYIPPVPKPVTNIRIGGFVESGINNFPYGYCTYYVGQKRPVSWGGNAAAWYGNAQAAGHAVGSIPRVGSIMVTSESYYGHVAYVESVNSDGSFTVSEMNYAGWGVVDYRSISPGSVALVGFIY